MAIDRRSFLLAAASLVRAADDARFSTDVRVVNILATVRDRKGHLITDLTREDFVLEDNGQPQTIRYFGHEPDLPLSLGLLVDTSLSQRRLLGVERAASYEFFDTMRRQGRDQAYVIHFDRDVELLQDFTSSAEDLKAALASLGGSDPEPHGSWIPAGSWRRGRYGGTALYDAILLACQELMQKRQGRKALILLTDGVDIGSRVSLDDAVRSALRADTLVYSVLFADASFYEHHRDGGPSGKEVLQQISGSTGGGFFAVSRSEPIDRIYKRIEEELRSQYSIGYAPDRPADGFHRLRLSTTQGFAVQARDGYYTVR